jgi:predicted aminopeptidase
MKILALLVAVCVPGVSSCYVTTQGIAQLKLLNSRKDIDQVINDDSVDDKTKKKLKFTKLTLEFAKEQELEVGDSYSKFVSLEGPAVSYLVQASKPTEFKLKTWWFPVVGSVPYLGFFRESDRSEYERELQLDGFETSTSFATAFSGLGWFSDPIYSTMLAEDDADLAHLYFHELTHKTAWLKGSVELNENLAEFVGEELTQKFFEKLGRSQDLEIAKTRRKDRELFKVWLKNLKSSLEDYYKSTKATDSPEFSVVKKLLIEQHVKNKPAFKVADFVGSKNWNATRVLAASLYSPDTEAFKKAYDCAKIEKMGEFAKKIRSSVEQSGTIQAGLASICHEKALMKGQSL